MSLGHSGPFKLRRRAPENTHSDGDRLVMDCLTQFVYVHSMASELLGPRFNLKFCWISLRPLPGLVGCALPSGAQGLAVPISCRMNGSYMVRLGIPPLLAFVPLELLMLVTSAAFFSGA